MKCINFLKKETDIDKKKLIKLIMKKFIKNTNLSTVHLVSRISLLYTSFIPLYTTFKVLVHILKNEINILDCIKYII